MLIIQWTQYGGPIKLHAQIFIGSHVGLKELDRLWALKVELLTHTYMRWIQVHVQIESPKRKSPLLRRHSCPMQDTCFNL